MLGGFAAPQHCPDECRWQNLSFTLVHQLPITTHPLETHYQRTYKLGIYRDRVLILIFSHLDPELEFHMLQSASIKTLMSFRLVVLQKKKTML